MMSRCKKPRSRLYSYFTQSSTNHSHFMLDSRTVSSLTPLQLFRKRAKDREAQRVKRARNKAYILQLERELCEVRHNKQHNTYIQELLYRNTQLELELKGLREMQTYACRVNICPGIVEVTSPELDTLGGIDPTPVRGFTLPHYDNWDFESKGFVNEQCIACIVESSTSFAVTQDRSLPVCRSMHP